jgi:AAA+ ATPase superfamily predicted ATPase
MKFYDRHQELSELNKLFDRSQDAGVMIALTGRRRVGKTHLALHFAHEHPKIYFFVSKKTEYLLCKEYLDILRQRFDLPLVGEIHSFSQIFELILQLAQKNHFILIIDEFQEFFNINPSVYSDIQRLWDLNKEKVKLNVIFIGSVYSLMYKIFEHSKEPLFGRADRIIKLNPFSVSTIQNILNDYGFTNIETCFEYYLLTGGLPKYIDILLSEKISDIEAMKDFIFYRLSPFLEEGKNVLIEEFGKEYGVYFSILELISCGKNSQSEIEGTLEKSVGGYLERLVHDYALITHCKPINAKLNSKSVRYRMNDQFLKFWFYFIYRNRSAVETENFIYLKAVFEKQYSTYAGKVLEDFFRQRLIESQQYNQVGSYWDKTGQNEIDIVAINDLKKEILCCEVKFNPQKIDMNVLANKMKCLQKFYPDYTFSARAFTLKNAGTSHADETKRAFR